MIQYLYYTFFDGLSLLDIASPGHIPLPVSPKSLLLRIFVGLISMAASPPWIITKFLYMLDAWLHRGLGGVPLEPAIVQEQVCTSNLYVEFTLYLMNIVRLGVVYSVRTRLVWFNSTKYIHRWIRRHGRVKLPVRGNSHDQDHEYLGHISYLSRSGQMPWRLQFYPAENIGKFALITGQVMIVIWS